MSKKGYVAVVDYGLGNVFSVLRACEHVGQSARLTADPQEIKNAAAVILPGVGAYGDAMNTLRKLQLIDVLRQVASSGVPFMGICLGLQLLMDESTEFGRHEGLGLIKGDVVRLTDHTTDKLKVPEVGWNKVQAARPWGGSLLQGMKDGALQYFVHSYYVRPTDPEVALSWTQYGSTRFVSSVQKKNIFACQFHPERSGPAGLMVYQNLRAAIEKETVIHHV